MIEDSVPIDFVVPWVDGNDKRWLTQRSRVLGDSSSMIAADYRDWDLMRFFFRGIEEFAPWVNKVHFVTWGHFPSWLNTDCEKLNIVRHEQFIPQKYLPTFSSHVIDLNVHRIEGLSEHFVYFNDDTFLLRPVQKNIFFRNDLPCDCAIANPIVPKFYRSISSLMVNNISIINQHFSKNAVMANHLNKWFNFRYGLLGLLNILFLPWPAFPGLLETHLPASFKKSTFQTVWDVEGELLDVICGHRVRNFKTDVNQWLIKEWQIASNQFIPRSTCVGKNFLVKDPDDIAKASKWIRHQKSTMICVNDHCIDEEVFCAAKKDIADAFGGILSKRSCFERDNC